MLAIGKPSSTSCMRPTTITMASLVRLLTVVLRVLAYKRSLAPANADASELTEAIDDGNANLDKGEMLLVEHAWPEDDDDLE